ncbi:MmcQ/YjbR family DNA-binding protein [Pontibacter silvestris]|uniref:MmcQ/YjbR family DNA-binding protein n=1 Tax=Pontibacter silvestris TaxID=2305183 RepID=A0ABW4X1E0_9BACT|nr:MmcQ/YjbR family DNA-binding protein [Pontibacter silvestris]MCC9138256.1 MmcQ/YjbR family DNA-binding protein [Pontibacter silvestris]
MSIEDFRDYCLAKHGTSEETPFDDDTLVFKVCGKIYALTSISNFKSGINLKCNPELAVELRERYCCVVPGYHMSKKHWNTVLPNNCVPDILVLKWTDDSYNLIAEKLTKAQKQLIGL